MFKYKTRFSNIVTASKDFEGQSFFSKASLDSLKTLIPSSVDLDRNIDLVGVAFNAAVVNFFNKNDDCIDTSTALAFKKYFVHKPTNIEHKKQKVVGHIVNAGFSRYGSNELLSDEEVQNTAAPFNISLAAVVYRTVDKTFADALIASNDASSPFFQKISASWEIGFNDYYVVLGSEQQGFTEIITDAAQIKDLSKYLKSCEGSGKMDDGTLVRRLITGRIYPLGIGYTTNPAANVSGVVVDDGNAPCKCEDEEEDDKEEVETDEDESIDVDAAKCLKTQIVNEKISQSETTTVNINKQKLMDLEQIIAAFQKVLSEKKDTIQIGDEAVASISAKIAESIKAKDDEFKAQTAAAEAEKARLTAEAEQNKKDLTEALARLSELEAAAKARATSELFNSRMSALDAEYDFEDADRTILAKDLSGLENTDEAFAAYKDRVAVLFKHKNKASKADNEKQIAERVEKEIATRIAAAKGEGKKDLEAALASAKPVKDGKELDSRIDPTPWKERIAKNFSKENLTVTY